MATPPPPEAPRTLLLTLTGKDRPGVTSRVFATLGAFGVEVLDIEQIVLRRRLVLGVLVTLNRDWRSLREAVERVATELDMQVEVDRGTGDNRARPEGRSHVTVLGMPLRAAAFAAIAGRIADTGANIDRIERVARYPVTALGLDVSGTRPDRLPAPPAPSAGPPRPRPPPGPAPRCAGGGPPPPVRRRRRAADEPAAARDPA